MKVFLLANVIFISANLLAQQPVFRSQTVNLSVASQPINTTKPASFLPTKDADSQDVKKKIAPNSVKIHLLPLFGGYEKNDALKKIDDEFLRVCDKNFESRSKASEFFAQRAWEYLEEGQKDTATYRFNLAYLLDDENVDAYWGLGVIEFQKNNAREAINLMKKGLEIDDNDNITLKVDLATIYIQCFITENKPEDLSKAFDLLDAAIRQQPEFANAYMQLALAEILNGQPEKAWISFHKGYEIDPDIANPDILQALLEKKADPKGIFKQ